jgi:hypothetical protein
MQLAEPPAHLIEFLDRYDPLDHERQLALPPAPGLIMACPRCDGTGRVCEAHISRPWDGPNACGCGAAGAPCGRCNNSDDGEWPRLPAGFKTDIDEDGWQH